MIELPLEIHTAEGTADAVVIRPDSPTRLPGVLHLSDIHGLREAHLQLSRRIAALGYVVLAPNVFYRTARPPLFDFETKSGDERTRKRFAELGTPLTPEAMERDAGTYVDLLGADAFVTAGALAVVGHCFTGSMALRTAAIRPGPIRAAASLHGGRLFTTADTSPHLVLPRVHARLYFAHARNDRSMPQDAIDELEKALRAWGGSYESEVYEAAHGWTMPDSSSYDPAAALRAFEKLKDLLAISMPSPVASS